MTSWISRNEAKAQLNQKATSGAPTPEDEELDGFIAAACGIVEDVKGHVTPTPFARTLTALRTHERSPLGGYRDRWFLDLPDTPVLTISSLATASGATVTPLPAAHESVLPVPGPGSYTVGYVAGLPAVPANFRLAALELVWELWRATQANGSGGRPMNNGQTVIVPASPKTIPYPRVRMLLGIYGDTVADHTVIA